MSAAATAQALAELIRQYGPLAMQMLALYKETRDKMREINPTEAASLLSDEDLIELLQLDSMALMNRASALAAKYAALAADATPQEAPKPDGV